MKLCDIVTVEVNNENCVVLKVKENSFMNLITLGCFDGKETMFRLTKGSDHTCTVWTSDGKSYSWHWGISGYTLVSEKMKEQGRLIARCIVDDFKISLS